MSKWSITPDERKYVRELAYKYLEVANLPIMDERRKQWLDLNTGKAAKPPVVIETWTFNPDFMPDGIMQTQSEGAASIEWVLLTSLRNHELLDDDKVYPPFFRVGWNVEVDKYGIDIETIQASQPGIAYQFKHPIQNIEEDYLKVKQSQIRFDKKGSLEWKEFVENVIGDILPVKIEGGPSGFGLTQSFIKLMGMENFYVAMIDHPEIVHYLMRLLTDDYIHIARWLEENELLTVLNSYHDIASSYLFTDELPAPGYNGIARLKDIWVWAESQETSGVSPNMFKEFCLPYYAEICAIMGKVYYGCCEPVHLIHEMLLKSISNISKISISKWCDENVMGEALKGSKIVYSRKPDPTYIGIGSSVLDEHAWSKHVKTTLEATSGCQVEFIMRDIYSTCGNLNKAKRAIEIVRELT